MRVFARNIARTAVLFAPAAVMALGVTLAGNVIPDAMAATGGQDAAVVFTTGNADDVVKFAAGFTAPGSVTINDDTLTFTSTT